MIGTREQKLLGLDRLEILALGIRDPARCGHEVFDFSIINNTLNPECWTSGCMAGECPIFFPDDWMWISGGLPVLSGGDLDTSHSLHKFFALCHSEESHIFHPSWQNNERYGGVLLLKNATRYEVSDNALEFIRREREKLGIETLK